MIEQIKIDADKFADQQMQTVYKNQKDHLTELHKYLGLLFVTYAADGLLKVTPFQKNNIMADLKTKLAGMAKDMSSTEINQVMDILEKNYTDTYYENAYVMDSGIDVNLKFDILKKEYIDAAVNNPVDGELFSDRIWSNKVAVVDKVKQGIVDAMDGDTTIDKLGKDIQTAFNIGAYESQRLVNTENARVQCQAIDDIGESAGCTQQMYCATLEANTCSECAEYDGQYFDIDDDSKPDIPLHPNCRCLYINVPPTGWEPSVRKDNESKDIIDYEDYNSWLNNKGIDNNGKDDIIKENGIGNMDINNSIVSNVNWDKYFEISQDNSNKLNQIHSDLNEFMNKNNREKLFLLNVNENSICGELEGSKDNEIRLNDNILQMLKNSNNNSIIFAHNHPSATTFSSADIEKIIKYKSIRTLTLECKDGTKYFIDRGNLKSSLIKEIGFFSKYEKIYNEIAIKYPELNDEVKIYDIWNDFLNEVNQNVAEYYGMVYGKVE